MIAVSPDKFSITLLLCANAVCPFPIIPITSSSNIAKVANVIPLMSRYLKSNVYLTCYTETAKISLQDYRRTRQYI